jgi:hypothetical protein
VGGNGASLTVEGITAGLCRPVMAQTGLGAEPDWHQRTHSASYAAVMAWISASWWYILPTLLAVSGGLKKFVW